MPTFGENLKALRISKRLSQEKFAEAIGSNQACITAWERGTRIPHLTVIQGIADTFKVPLSTLLPLANTGNESDADRELLDIIRSNPKIRQIVEKTHYLSNADINMILDVIGALTRERV